MITRPCLFADFPSDYPWLQRKTSQPKGRNDERTILDKGMRRRKCTDDYLKRRGLKGPSDSAQHSRGGCIRRRRCGPAGLQAQAPADTAVVPKKPLALAPGPSIRSRYLSGQFSQRETS